MLLIAPQHLKQDIHPLPLGQPVERRCPLEPSPGRPAPGRVPQLHLTHEVGG
jgi:hypothetical protein